MQPDIIEEFKHQQIQHGKFNDRIYLMKFSPKAGDSLPDDLKKLAEDKGYSKVFAKVPADHAGPFEDAGFVCEATVPGFFNGLHDVCFLSCFIDPKRQTPHSAEINEQVIAACNAKQSDGRDLPSLPTGMTLRPCTPADADTMAVLYKRVFASYPFPIDDPAYIRETMASHVDYFGIWEEDKLIALSSAEMDVKAGNVEMTDFATDPPHRGQGLAIILLAEMEKAMQARKIPTAYSIARAASFGMNITFAKMGYTFAGSLIKNTQISGQFEDMNIWFKSI